MQNLIQTHEANVKGQIILPLSGGFDSRLLASMTADKKRLRCFTYGMAPISDRCVETVRARALAQKLGLNWAKIELGEMNDYIPDWLQRWGATSNVGGLYHLEFFAKVLTQIEAEPPPALLSGLIGDVWARPSLPPVEKPGELMQLTYPHSLNADSNQLTRKQKRPNKLTIEYFETNKENLKNARFRAIAGVRFKIIYLNFLLRIPEIYGFKPYSPFLNENLALAMLRLPDSERKGRYWQERYFQKNGINDVSLPSSYDKSNFLFHKSLLIRPLAPLCEKKLSEIINPAYILAINAHIDIRPYPVWHPVWRFKVDNWLHKAKYKTGLTSNPQLLRFYWPYMVLYPLQYLIETRDNYGKNVCD